MRVPLFWMLLGPPAIRVAVEDDRNGLSSLSGDSDIWNYIRLAWWLFFGFVAILSLVRHRGLVKQFMGRVGLVPYWVALFLGSLLVASFASSAPLFCVANVTMMVLLAAAATDLAVKVFAGHISATRALRALLWIAVGLLVFVGAMYVAFPGLRWSGYFGYRLRGESFAYVPILALVCTVVGAHFVLSQRGVGRLAYAAAALFGVYWLILAQTRSAYLCLAFAVATLAWYQLSVRREHTVILGVVAASFTGLVFVLLLYGNSGRATWYLDNLYNRFVIRDYWAMRDPSVHHKNLATLNGRTEAAAVLIDGVAGRPFGFGYIGGVRMYMARPENLDRLPDEAFIGAHNGYLEVLGGGGVLALLAYLLLLGTFVVYSFRFRTTEARVIQALLLMVMLEGLFESEIAYPFHQSPVILWFAGALIVAAVARESALKETGTRARRHETPRFVGAVGYPLSDRQRT